jgi:hypothetical protein
MNKLEPASPAGLGAPCPEVSYQENVNSAEALKLNALLWGLPDHLFCTPQIIQKNLIML